MKKKTVWAYIDGKKQIDVLQAALDNNIMLAEMKERLVKANAGHEVVFRTEGVAVK